MKQDITAWLEVYKNKSFISSQAIYLEFLNYCMSQTESYIGYIHLFDSQTNEIRFNVWSENVVQNCSTMQISHYPLSEAGIWADSIRQCKVVVHNNYSPNYKGQLPEGHIRIINHLSAPVIIDNSIVAVVGIGNKETDFTSQNVKKISDLIDRCWPAVTEKVYELEEKQNMSFSEMYDMPLNELIINLLTPISKATEIKDEYTAFHQKNVSIISKLIGVELGLNDIQLQGLEISGLLHDIGKIGIPSSILNKSSKLSNIEMELIKTHAQIGADIFSTVKAPWPLYDAIHQHHERLDGSGYPQGLVEEEIILEAKILAVADTFDAMALDRPYRKCPGIDKALDAIRCGRGIAFDPYVVDAFFRVYYGDRTLGGNY